MLQKLQTLKKKDEGFTIIEVLIVLAIGALILVIVLIAIPQLQRNQRNTSRKSDISRVATSVNEFVSNSNGQVPTTSAHLTTITGSLGTLGQYTLVVPGTITTIGANSLTLTTGTQSAMPAGTNNVNLGSIQIVTGATCAAGGATAANTNSRRVAIQYLTETAGTPNPVCQDVQ